MLSRRFLSATPPTRAKALTGVTLWSSSPPPPPLPDIVAGTIRSRLPTRQTPASDLKPIQRAPADSSKSTGGREGEIRHQSQRVGSGREVLEWRLANRDARRGSEDISTPSSEGADLAEAAQLDLFLLRTLAQLDVGESTVVSLQELLRMRDGRSGAMVEPGTATLEYEPTPSRSRRVRLDGEVEQGEAHERREQEEEQDGTVVVAYVVGGEVAQVSVCSGFAVGKEGGKEGEQGQVIVTCAHTLAGMERYLPSYSSSSSSSSSSIPKSASTSSASFVLTSSGHAYPVSSVLSHSQRSDLLLLQLSPLPLNPSTIPVRRLRSLPISPYSLPTTATTTPEIEGGGVSVHRYLNPLGRLRRKLAGRPEREWDVGRVVEYKNSKGQSAEPGTHDELGWMSFSCAPTPGSSGGPVVCRETGSVVGVTRGSSHVYGDRQAYGFATPSEKILELFPIPGFKTTSQRAAEREAQEATAEAESAPSSSSSSSSQQHADPASEPGSSRIPTSSSSSKARSSHNEVRGK